MNDHISFSEIQTLQRCKRLWHYTYGLGFEPVREDAKLTAGRWMHELLAAYHARKSWTDVHAVLTSLAVDACLFDEERQSVYDAAQLYDAIMWRYADYWPESWEVLWHEDKPLVERELLLPLPSGSQLKVKIDLVVRDTTDGLIYVNDHKTKQDFDKNIEARLDFDPQLSYYTWGLRQIGINVAGGIHNYIRMRLPGVPKLNKDGTMNKSHIITDEATVREFIVQTGARVTDEELAAYLGQLSEAPFFRRYKTMRSDDELAAIVEEIQAKVRERELARQEGLYTRTLISDCVRCPFYRPCLTSLKGGDESLILSEQYRRKEGTEVALPDYMEGGE